MSEPAAPPIENWEVLDLLTSLVQKSLVVYEEDEQGRGRYRLLETVRQYARDRLVEAREADAVRERHRDWFLALAERLRREPDTGRAAVHSRSLDRLETEYDNLRAALAWCGAQGEAEAGLRLGLMLAGFWHVRGYWTEGREHLARLLALPGAEARTPERAGALRQAGILARYQGEYETARALLEESLAINREREDKAAIAGSLISLGWAAHDPGEYEAARALFEESLAIYREESDQEGIAASILGLGAVAHCQGEYGAARALFEESLAIYREIENRIFIGRSLAYLGMAVQAQGEHAGARALFQESLVICRALGDKRCMVQDLEGLAAVAAAQAQQPEGARRAARLFGAAEGLRQAIGHPLSLPERAEYDRCIAAARTALGEKAFAAAWAEGRAMALEDTIQYALAEREP